MKIAHVSSEYFPTIGGVGQVVRELAERQVKEGHEVHVFTSDWDKKGHIPVLEEIIEGVYVHRCKYLLQIANFAVIFPSVFNKLLKNDFDIIHSHVFGHVHFVLAAFAAKIKKIPHVHTTHCPWSDAYRSFTGRLGILISYNIFSRLALKLTNKIIAITPWEIDFIKKYGGSKEKIEVIPNGMAEIFFNKISPNNFKRKNKINGRLVLYFGRLNVTKGPDKFVEIAKLILKDKKDVTFVIRGPDEGMRETVKKLIGKEKRIILMNETRDRKEIASMYQSADVFVLPSYREGLPLTLFEAMASGLPIVASPVNGVPYEMSEPENGFLIDYGENEKYKKRIIELLENTNLRKKISKNNIEKSKKYNWDIISKRTLNLYKSLLDHK
ncbi:MAG: glycosyltransferase family 4 protein [Nanoarchaeota archaeon]|nr:glycosyltransferase family 4 protein [Nanoarchaeota archaeon]